MYHVSAQGIDERIINVHYYYYHMHVMPNGNIGLHQYMYQHLFPDLFLIKDLISVTYVLQRMIVLD